MEFSIPHEQPESPSLASDRKYYYVEQCVTWASEKDIDPNHAYATYEEARNSFKYEWDEDFNISLECVITKLNDRWYGVKKDEYGQLVYQDLYALQLKSWRTEEEINRGIDLNSIPVKDLMAIAAATAYCNGTLAKELAIKQEELRSAGFYEKFTAFFGKPMREFSV